MELDFSLCKILRNLHQVISTYSLSLKYFYSVVKYCIDLSHKVQDLLCCRYELCIFGVFVRPVHAFSGLVDPSL